MSVPFLPDELGSVARTRVRNNSAVPTSDAKRRILNFIPGTNISLTITDDPSNEKVDITIATTDTTVGTPKAPASSFTVPTNYFLDQMYRLTLAGAVRATLQGTADLILTDDFAARRRIVLH